LFVFSLASFWQGKDKPRDPNRIDHLTNIWWYSSTGSYFLLDAVTDTVINSKAHKCASQLRVPNRESRMTVKTERRKD
jgi:hypothetical protein